MLVRGIGAVVSDYALGALCYPTHSPKSGEWMGHPKFTLFIKTALQEFFH
jgi:hypothetical protein